MADRRTLGAPTVLTADQLLVVIEAAPVVQKRAALSAPDDHFAARPDRSVKVTRNRCSGEAHWSPTVSRWIVASAVVQCGVGPNEPTPNDHFAARPHGRVKAARVGANGVQRSPTVARGIVARAVAQIAAIVSAPDDHLAAGPYRRVIVARGGRASGGHCRPTVARGIVSATVIPIGARAAEAAPDDHLAAGPNCRVPEALERHARGGHCRPSVGRRIVARSVIQNKPPIDAAPDDHLTARPHRRLPEACGGRAGEAERRPIVPCRIVARSVVQAHGVGAAPHDHLAARPHRRVKVTHRGKCPAAGALLPYVAGSRRANPDIAGADGRRWGRAGCDRLAARHRRTAARGDALVGSKKLRAVFPIAEPDAQPQIGAGENGRGHGGHVRERGIAEEDGVTAFADRERDGRRRLAACGAGSVIAPIRCRAGGIDDGELEAARALEVHAPNSDAALVVDELRPLRVCEAGEEERRQDRSECCEKSHKSISFKAASLARQPQILPRLSPQPHGERKRKLGASMN